MGKLEHQQDILLEHQQDILAHMALYYITLVVWHQQDILLETWLCITLH